MSALPAATRSPFVLIATPEMANVGPGRVRSIAPLASVQMRTCLSSQPVTSFAPSAESVALDTAPAWLRTAFLSAGDACQSLTLPSAEADK